MASAASDPSAGGATVKPRQFPIDRYIAPFFITCILVVGNLAYHILESVPSTMLAIVTSMAMELFLGRMFTGKWPQLASAYITGISVGILVRSPILWPYALCSAIAITSKYVIRYKGRHLWNPSNLGIVCLMLLAPQYASTLGIQFGNAMLPMIVVWCVGAFVIYRLKRFHICLTYVVSFFAFSFVRSLILHGGFLTEIAPITGPMYQLYIFFMITDPKTTVKSKQGQILVAFLIAVVECALRTWGSLAAPNTDTVAGAIATHAPYFALTIVGPVAMLVEIYRQSHKAVTVPTASSTATVVADPIPAVAPTQSLAAPAATVSADPAPAVTVKP